MRVVGQDWAFEFSEVLDKIGTNIWESTARFGRGAAPFRLEILRDGYRKLKLEAGERAKVVKRWGTVGFILRNFQGMS